MQIDELGSGEYIILCICEGTAEQDIMDCLLDEQRLIFRREHLLDQNVKRERDARKIEDKYLSYRHDKPIVILRILDSRKERFKLRKVYQERYCERVFSVFTRPEIEILVIIHHGDFGKYTTKRKSSTKPSEYCKEHYSMPNIKSKGQLIGCFPSSQALVDAICEYASSIKTSEHTLKDLLAIP